MGFYSQVSSRDGFPPNLECMSDDWAVKSKKRMDHGMERTRVYEFGCSGTGFGTKSRKSKAREWGWWFWVAKIKEKYQAMKMSIKGLKPGTWRQPGHHTHALQQLDQTQWWANFWLISGAYYYLVNPLSNFLPYNSHSLQWKTHHFASPSKIIPINLHLTIK